MSWVMIDGMYFRSGAAENWANRSVVQPAARSSSSRASRSRVATFTPPGWLLSDVEFVQLAIVPVRGVRVDYLSGKTAITDRVVANEGGRG
jgi:predicted anti-sigma-YlaC factor YlaD